MKVIMSDYFLCTYYYNNYAIAQLITDSPKNVTAALGTNATFSCRGNGEIRWEIAGTHVLTEQQVQLFSQEKVYVPLPTPSFSELIMTATEMYNFTTTIIISQIDPGFRFGKSRRVILFTC